MPLGYALEAARNRLATGRGDLREDGVAERTARCGRLLQPRTALLGALIAAGTFPFRIVQRASPTRGPGLVAWGVAPEGGGRGTGWRPGTAVVRGSGVRR